MSMISAPPRSASRASGMSWTLTISIMPDSRGDAAGARLGLGGAVAGAAVRGGLLGDVRSWRGASCWWLSPGFAEAVLMGAGGAGAGSGARGGGGAQGAKLAQELVFLGVVEVAQRQADVAPSGGP